MIKIKSLSKEYIMGDNKLLALNEVNISINAGEFDERTRDPNSTQGYN